MPPWTGSATQTAAAASSLLQRSAAFSARATPFGLPLTPSLCSTTSTSGWTPGPALNPPTRSPAVHSMAGSIHSPHRQQLNHNAFSTRHFSRCSSRFSPSPYPRCHIHLPSATRLSAHDASRNPPTTRSLHIPPKPSLVVPPSHPLTPFPPTPFRSIPNHTLLPMSAPLLRRINSTSSPLSNPPPESPTPPGDDPTISPKDPSDPSQVTTHITDEAKATPGEDHAAVQAHRAGKLGFGFSAGGLLFSYFAGVCHSLKHHGILQPGMPIAGSSAGSLIAAAVNSGLPDEAVLESTLRMAHDCRENGTRYRLSEVLRTSLEEMLPEDAHVKCSGNTFVSVTQVVPWMKGVVVSDFSSRDELISALVTSCHIPWYFDGRWMARFRGGYFMDGAVLNPLPSPPGVDYTCKVCCFPSKVVNSYLSGLDIAIAPDVMEEFSYAMVDYLGWAVLPAEEAAIVDLYEKGRRDGTAWVRSVGLQQAQAAAGQQPQASSAA